MLPYLLWVMPLVFPVLGLFYVGMTRAKERLTLTHVTVRNYFGSERWQNG